MEDRAVWIIYSDESRFNYGAVRGVGAVSLRRDDSARLSDELARLLHDAGLREMKWEKVRTGRAVSAAGKGPIYRQSPAELGWARRAQRITVGNGLPGLANR